MQDQQGNNHYHSGAIDEITSVWGAIACRTKKGVICCLQGIICSQRAHSSSRTVDWNSEEAAVEGVRRSKPMHALRSRHPMQATQAHRGRRAHRRPTHVAGSTAYFQVIFPPTVPPTVHDRTTSALILQSESCVESCGLAIVERLKVSQSHTQFCFRLDASLFQVSVNLSQMFTWVQLLKFSLLCCLLLVLNQLFLTHFTPSFISCF